VVEDPLTSARASPDPYLLLASIHERAGRPFGAVRFDQRRDQIVTEANAIGTAYQRLDLLPADAQPELRGLHRQ
jgi:hypothetical protein